MATLQTPNSAFIYLFTCFQFLFMNEQLLQYIWQYQHFTKQSLKLDNGDEFQVVHPGQYNADKERTFLDAKIIIAGTLWVGNIELYLKTSDLIRHRLQPNHINDNILLYVVWENDQPDRIIQIPVFSLQPKASTVHQTILESGQKQLNVPKENNELFSLKEMNMLKKELKIIKSLHKLIGAQNKSPMLKGDIRSLKIIAWQRETVRFHMEYGGYAKHVPKILLLGNWLTEAGFNCDNRVSVIPLTNMLIIIPDKQ